MEESERIDPATLAGAATAHATGLGTAARAADMDAETENLSLAAATAALIAARWRPSEPSSWVPPEQRRWARATSGEPELPPQVARGSASVSDFSYLYPNGNGNARGRAASVSPAPVGSAATVPHVPVSGVPPTPPADFRTVVPVSPVPPPQPVPVAPPDPSAAAERDDPLFGPRPLEPAPPGSEPTLWPGERRDSDLAEPTYSGPPYAEPSPPFTEPSDVDARHRQDQLNIDTEPMLPQRVPAEPDVPDVPLSPDDPLREAPTGPLTEPRELSRIANYLSRYGKPGEPAQRREGFDVEAILAAVRSVPHVRDARLRHNPSGAHILRIELVDGADAGLVSREVARLLKDTMGLAAEPNPPVRQSADETTLDRPPTGTARLHRPYVSAATQAAGRTRGDTRVSPGGGLEQHSGLPLPRRNRGDNAGGDLARVVLDHVQVTTLGVDAEVEVRLAVTPGGYAVGKAHGPGIDAFLLRLAATAAADAIGQLLIVRSTGEQRGRCFVEHVAVVPFGGLEVAVVVLLLVCGGWAEQLAGSAIINGDPRQAVVRATLSAVNRRLESLLA